MRKNDRILSTMLIKQVDALWSASMTPSIDNNRLYESMRNYKPGDWVVMWIVLPEDMPERLGRLIIQRDEIVGYDDFPDENGFRDFATDTFWYIELIDGKLFKWHNVQPLKVLQFNEPTDEENAAWAEEAVERHHLNLSEDTDA